MKRPKITEEEKIQRRLANGSKDGKHVFISHQEQLMLCEARKARRIISEMSHVKPTHHVSREKSFPTTSEFWNIWRGHDVFCDYCGAGPLVEKNEDSSIRQTVDHVIPLSRGGDPEDMRNLVWACQACNNAKGNLLPEEWDTLRSKIQ